MFPVELVSIVYSVTFLYKTNGLFLITVLYLFLDTYFKFLFSVQRSISFYLLFIYDITHFFFCFPDSLCTLPPVSVINSLLIFNFNELIMKHEGYDRFKLFNIYTQSYPIQYDTVLRCVFKITEGFLRNIKRIRQTYIIWLPSQTE